MKFQCKKSDILTNVQQAQSIVGQRSTLPILSHLLLEAKGNALYFSSTDLEISLTSSSAVNVSQEGKTTVPARKFFDLIRSLPEELLSVELIDNNVLQVKCGKSLYRICGFSSENFPQLPDFSDNEFWEFDQIIFKNAIQNTHYAISRDESRYVLNGIYIVLNSSEVMAVATDGRRLSIFTQKGLSFGDRKIDFVLPSKTVNELLKLIDGEGSIRIFHRGNQACFQMGTIVLVSQLIEGIYPEYKQVIPDLIEFRAVFNTKPLVELLQRVSILTSEKFNSVKMVFEAHQCTITANTPDVGEAKEEIPIQYDGPENLAMAFNPNFFLDILKCTVEETVSLEMNHTKKEGLIKEGDGLLAVIMPMRIHVEESPVALEALSEPALVENDPESGEFAQPSDASWDS